MNFQDVLFLFKSICCLVFGIFLPLLFLAEDNKGKDMNGSLSDAE